MPLESIFGYPSSQLHMPEQKTKKGVFDTSIYSRALFGEGSKIGQVTLFKQWCDYLHICEQLSWTDYTPERFITKYNYALEAVGREPIIYEPVRQLGGTYFVIGNHEMSCRGHFPCDEDGAPILRWTSLIISNAKARATLIRGKYPLTLRWNQKQNKARVPEMNDGGHSCFHLQKSRKEFYG